MLVVLGLITMKLCIFSSDIKAEGLFRKTGNVTRQRLLKEWIRQGAELHLDDGTFSPHDIATVLKQFLAELPEPLLTQKHFDAYCQIVGKRPLFSLIKIFQPHSKI